MRAIFALTFPAATGVSPNEPAKRRGLYRFLDAVDSALGSATLCYSGRMETKSKSGQRDFVRSGAANTAKAVRPIRQSLPAIASSPLLFCSALMAVAATPPKPVPVTVVMESPDSRIVQATRGDGSQADESEESGLLGSTPTLRHIRFASGEQVLMSVRNRKKSTVFDPARSASEWLRDPVANCLKPAPAHESLLGVENVGQYRAVKVAVTTRRTSWFALDYGCATLQYIVPMSKTSTNFVRFVSLKPGEPSPELFAIPAEFKEVPPSQISPANEAADSYYFAHRPH